MVSWELLNSCIVIKLYENLSIFILTAVRVEVVGSAVVTLGDKHTPPEKFFVIGMNVFGKGG